MKTKILCILFFTACCTIQAQTGEKPSYRYLTMIDELLKGVPDYWKTGLDDIETTIAGIKKGTVERICLSAGGRPVYRLFYGKPNEVRRTANISSAMGARNRKYYADKTAPDYRPTVFLVGAVHGAEMEGIAALMNLIAILETGKDLAGMEYPTITASAEKMNFIIVPCANPDGRARVPLPSMVGLDFESFRYLSQGTWKDGTLTGYPTCYTVHPILNAVEHLGAYFNDDGINLSCDFFFTDPTAETKALLQTAETFAPDFTLFFHGGDNTTPLLMGAPYLFQDSKEKVRAFEQLTVNRFKDAGFPFTKYSVDETRIRAFNLTSAIAHVCGEPAVTFESNQGLDDARGIKCTYDEIYRHHTLLIEGLCEFVLN